MGLHPQAIICFGLLVLQRLERGYRVILSTHSPILLDLVWAIRVAPAIAFRQAVDNCGDSQHEEGLQALARGEGKGQVSGKDPKKILGSVAIDEDSRKAHAQANRWDYLVGYNRDGQAIAHFIEVHSAETSEVTVIEKKLEWLERLLLEEERRDLAALPRHYHWVVSGRINIPQHTPQHKKLQTTLRRRGLVGPVKALVLG